MVTYTVRNGVAVITTDKVSISRRWVYRSWPYKRFLITKKLLLSWDYGFNPPPGLTSKALSNIIRLDESKNSPKRGVKAQTSTTYNHEYLCLIIWWINTNNGSVIKVTYLSGVSQERWYILLLLMVNSLSFKQIQSTNWSGPDIHIDTTFCLHGYTKVE